MAAIGDTLTYTVKVTNTGTSALTGVVLTDAIPAGTTYVAGSASGGGVFNSGTNKLTWAVGSLAPAEAKSFTFKVTVNPTTVARTVLNVAIVKSDQTPDKQAQASTGVVLGVKLVSLPKTGAQTDQLLMFAAGLILLGAGFELLRPRRVIKSS